MRKGEDTIAKRGYNDETVSGNTARHRVAVHGVGLYETPLCHQCPVKGEQWEPRESNPSDCSNREEPLLEEAWHSRGKV